MPETLPLFPLGSVLFPGVLLPLHVFEDRYRILVRSLLDAPEDAPRQFGVVAIRQGSESGPHVAAALHPVGCAAELRRVDHRSDGTYDLVTVGVRRFRLREVDTDSAPYLLGDIDWLPPEEPTGPEATLHASRVRELFEEYLTTVAATGGAEVTPYELPDEPAVLSYLVASATLLTLDDRQELLEYDDCASRLRAEIGLLWREIALVRELHAVPTSLAELEARANGG
ncbi:MAG: LON peptidase substrate-binding domain-containing protein [Mycobacteriales bacterium]